MRHTTSIAIAALLTLPAPAQVLQIQPTDLGNQQSFGHSVAVDGGYLLIGSDSDDDGGSHSGSAYLFRLPSGRRQAGTELIKLLAPNPVAGDSFGGSVAMQSGLALIGAPSRNDQGANSGCAFLFDVDPSSSTYGTRLLTLSPAGGKKNDSIGVAVDLDAGFALLGAVGDDGLGGSSGAAYLMDADPASPNFGQTLVKLQAVGGGSLDHFGASVSLSDGLALVGAYNALVGSARTGSAYLFDVDPASPTFGAQLAQFQASNHADGDLYGVSVALGSGFALVGAPNHDRPDFTTDRDGAAYLFDADPMSPTFGTLIQQLLPAHTHPHHRRLGYSVSLDGSFAAVGSPWEDVWTGGPSDWPHPWKAGSAYVFDVNPLSPQFCAPIAKLHDPTPRVVAYFGSSISIQDGVVLVGTPQDSGSHWTEYRAGAVHVTRILDRR